MSEPVKIVLQLVGAQEVAAGLQTIGQGAAALAQTAGRAADAVATKVQELIVAETSAGHGATKAEAEVDSMAGKAVASTQSAGEATKGIIAQIAAAANAAAAAIQKTYSEADSAAERAAYRVRAIAREEALATQQALGQAQKLKTAPSLPGGGLGSVPGFAAPTVPVDLVPKTEAATKATKEHEAAAKKAAQALKEQQEAASAAGQGLGQMFNAVFRLLGVQSPLAGGVGQSAAAAQELAAGAAAAAGGVGILVTGAVVAVAAVAALAAGLYEAAKGTGAFSDAQGKEAEKIGLSVDKWSKYQYAAKLSDLTNQELKVSLGHLSEEAVKGSKAFLLLGVAAHNSDGSTRELGELLEDVADKFAGYKDGLDKTALAHELFGRSGRELLPWLNEGREGMRKWGDELERMGGVVTPEMAEQGDRLGDALERLSTEVHSIWLQFGSRLVPIVADVTEKLVGLGSEAGKLGPLFDIAVAPLKMLAGWLSKYSDAATLAKDVTAEFAAAVLVLAHGGSIADARESLNDLTLAFEKYRNARAGIKDIKATTVLETERKDAPHVDTAAEKEAEKRKETEQKLADEIFAIREKGALELKELQAKEDRASLDSDYKEKRIGLDEYYQRRSELIKRDTALQIAAGNIAASTEEDLTKRAYQQVAAKNKAIQQERNAESELARDRGRDVEKRTAEEQKKEDVIVAIREHGQLQIEELQAKEERTALDSDYKQRRIGAEEYYARRALLIRRDYVLQVQAADIAAAAEEDVVKADAQNFAAKLKAVEVQRGAEAELQRERIADAQKLRELQSEVALDEAREKVRKIEEDTYLSISEKRAQTRAAMQEEIALLKIQIAGWKAKQVAADPLHFLEIEKHINSAIRELDTLTRKLNSLKPPTFFQAMGKRIDEMGEKWGNFAQNMTDALTGPIDSAMSNFGDSVIDVASGMKSWGEVGLNMLRQLLSGFITAIAEMLIHMIFFHRVKETQKQESTASNTTALGPAAALAGAESGLSFGTAAVIGLVAFAALMAAALAFKSGGPVPGGEQFIRVNEDDKPETVVNAEGTSRWAGLLAAINRGATTAADLVPHLGGELPELLQAAAQIQPQLPMPNFDAVAEHQRATAEISGRSAAINMPEIKLPPINVPPINVPENPTHVHYVDGQKQLAEFLRSNPGRRIIITHLDSARGALGLERS